MNMNSVSFFFLVALASALLSMSNIDAAVTVVSKLILGIAVLLFGLSLMLQAPPSSLHSGR